MTEGRVQRVEKGAKTFKIEIYRESTHFYGSSSDEQSPIRPAFAAIASPPCQSKTRGTNRRTFY